MKKNIIITAGILFIVIICSSFILVGLRASQKAQMTMIYETALEETLHYADASLSRAKYIAIDTDTMQGLSGAQKNEIIEDFKLKYNMKIIDASYLDLLTSGIEVKHEETTGVLLYVEKVDNYLWQINMHVAVTYGSLGGNGLMLKFEYKKGEWILKKVEESWIS